MGRKWGHATGKRILIKTIDGESKRERLAFWTGVKVALAAAAAVMKDIHHSGPFKIREFVDDVDLMMDPLIRDNDLADHVLDEFGIWMIKNPDDPGRTRFDIRIDTELCHSCGMSRPQGENIYCSARKCILRRGRHRCPMWRGAKGIPVNEWQRQIMRSGGPLARNDILDDRDEWLEMMDEIRTGKNT